MTKDHPPYDVGYKKPPKGKRFKKGQSGNKKGRPKGVKNIGTLFKKMLNESITIQENGKARKSTMRETIVRRTVIDAAKGNHKARETVFLHAKEPIKDPDHMTNDELLNSLLDKFDDQGLQDFIEGVRIVGAKAHKDFETS